MTSKSVPCPLNGPVFEVGSQRIQLNDFTRQWADTSALVLQAVARVGASGWYVLGKEVSDFELSLAEMLRCKEVVGCASGLDAIELALRATGLKRGERVLTTPLSAFATTLGILRAGGTPVFADVDDYGLISTEQCRDIFRADHSVRYFVPVHLYGHALNRQDLLELQREFNLTIVEDCAQSIGASFEGEPTGSVGAASALSFYPTKNLGALGDGGAVATSDGLLATQCRAIRNYGQTERYRHEVLGMNSRLDELQAAIIRDAYLPKLAAWTERRRTIANRYMNGIGNRNLRVPGSPAGSESVWHLFPVLVGESQREDFRSHLSRAGIESAIHYPTIIPDQVAMAGVDYVASQPLPRARKYALAEVSLPIHPYLESEEIERVINVINRWTP